MLLKTCENSHSSPFLPNLGKSLPKISATGVLAKYGEQEDVGEEIEAKNGKTMMKRDVSDGHSD